MIDTGDTGTNLANTILRGLKNFDGSNPADFKAWMKKFCVVIGVTRRDILPLPKGEEKPTDTAKVADYNRANEDLYAMLYLLVELPAALCVQKYEDESEVVLGPPDYLAQRGRMLQSRSNTAEQEGERLSCVRELRALLFGNNKSTADTTAAAKNNESPDSEKPVINFAGSNNDFGGGFMFTAAATIRFNPSTKGARLLVDSGVSESFLDDELIPGLKERMQEFKELSTSK